MRYSLKNHTIHINAKCIRKRVLRFLKFIYYVFANEPHLNTYRNYIHTYSSGLKLKLHPPVKKHISSLSAFNFSQVPWKLTYAMEHRLSRKCIYKFTSHLPSFYLPFAISRYFKRNAGAFSTRKVFLNSSLSLKWYLTLCLPKTPDSTEAQHKQ